MDPEAELIFGAIKDENMNGKIRVSIVATALDGSKSENKTVLNMVSRIQNRNNGYSDNLFSHNPRVENNTISSIDGATALKLDESYELNDQTNLKIDELEQSKESQLSVNSNSINEIPNGVSMESASYIESNNIESQDIDAISASDEVIEDYTPKLFSEEQSVQESSTHESNEQNNNEEEKLFEQDINENEDFEIPAFLRKQKF